MALGDVDSPAVMKAIAEHRDIGPAAFRRRYGFGRARRYALIVDGERYDSKAIIGAAHKHMAGEALPLTAFRGGERTVAAHLRRLGFTVESPADQDNSPASPASAREPLVLIAPSYGNPASRRRFHETLAQPVDFTVQRLRNLLTSEESDGLLARHPEGTARFWGALAHHNSAIDRLRDGDVVIFTGDNRVQAVGIMGYRFRNPMVAAALWPPKPGDEGWVNVYSVTGFQRLTDVWYPELRAMIGSADKDIFQSARLLNPAKSAAVITGFGITITPNTEAQHQQAEADLLAALSADGEIVDAEQAHITSTTYERTAGTVTVHRAEAMLVTRYRQSMAGTGDQRLRSAVGFTDLYLSDDGDIIEAKRAADHRYVRDALGQLLDYAVNTTVSVNRLTALFPEAPAVADISLLHTYGIDCLHWAGGNDFVRLTAPPQRRALMQPLWATTLQR
jgi:hypothetical protein